MAIGLLFAGGLGLSVASPTTTQPLLIQSPTIAQSALVNTAQSAVSVGRDKRTALRGLIGSWAGDDFEACLDLVYRTRSIVIDSDDVPA